MNSADGTIHFNSSFFAKTLFIHVFAWANGFVNPRKLKLSAVYKIKERFPERFMFQLSDIEFESLRSQIATSKTDTRGGRQYLPYAFTEQGVAILSAVLKSETAVKVSIQIMEAFVAMRHFLQNNAQIFTELNQLKRHQFESDKKIEELFDKMDKYRVEEIQGIFFQGQIFDAYSFFQKIIQKAKKEIILIDGYVDITVLDRFAKKNSGVNVKIYTQQNPKMKNSLTQLDIQNFIMLVRA